MQNKISFALLGVCLQLAASVTVAADSGNDCILRATMGTPCDASQSGTAATKPQGISIHPSNQLTIPADQGASSPNVIRNTQPDPLARGQRNDDVAYALARREPAAAPTQFQTMVENATGRLLPIFGQDTFDTPAMFSASQNVPVTADYVLGPGDEVIVRAWGQVDVDYHATVDRSGVLAIPKVGSINVGGVRYDQLQSLVKSSIGRIYNNFDLTVTLGQLRSHQVFVVGQVRHPGAYTVGPMSTLVNAVYLSGGPSGSGSLRRIELKRANRVISEFDFYDLLLKGDKSKDLRLQAGDVINVLSVGPQVAISGSVNAPAVFEAKDGESLGDLVAWAGGLATTAQTQRLSLQRNLNGSAREVQDVDLTAGGMKTPLKGGDIATVFAISPQLKNSVTLRGNLADSRHFAWRDGLRVRDLIPDREALITKDYWLGKNITLLSDPNNREVKNFNYQDKDKGAQGEIDRKTPMKRTLSEINWDYAVVERLDRETLTSSLIPFNLGRAIIEGADEDNLTLAPGDVITVFSKDDMQVPLEKRSVYVRLEGEFNRGGLYKIKQGETLRELVARVGGLTKDAYLLGTELNRESLRAEQQRAMDAAIQKAEAQLALNASYSAKQALTPEEAASTRANVEGQMEYLKKLKQIKATGRIVLNLAENARVSDLPSTVLQDGDVVRVPALPQTVSVLGEVTAPNSFLFTSGAKLADYIHLAGGPTNNGDESRFYVVHASGVTEASPGGYFNLSSLGSHPVLPGDEIVVPQLPEKVSYMKNFKDITQIFYQFGLGAAGIRVLTK